MFDLVQRGAVLLLLEFAAHVFGFLLFRRIIHPFFENGNLDELNGSLETQYGE